MADRNRLSPGGAIFMGLLFAVCGAIPMVLGLQTRPAQTADSAPAWVGMACGLLFVCAGALIIVNYAIARVDAAGNDAPNTPFAVRAVQYVLGLSITGMMLAIFAWVAFGRGERHFSVGIGIPGLWAGTRGGDMTGRVAFGFAAVLIAILFVVAGIAGAKQLRRSREAPDRE